MLLKVQGALARIQDPPLFTILLETIRIFCNIILTADLMGAPGNIKLWGKHHHYVYYLLFLFFYQEYPKEMLPFEAWI